MNLEEKEKRFREQCEKKADQEFEDFLNFRSDWSPEEFKNSKAYQDCIEDATTALGHAIETGSAIEIKRCTTMIEIFKSRYKKYREEANERRLNKKD